MQQQPLSTLHDTETETDTDKSVLNPMRIGVGFCPCAVWSPPHNSKKTLFLSIPLLVSALSSMNTPLGYSCSLWFMFSACFFTVRKRSLGQGNIFRSVCQEFCPQGGSTWAGTPPPGPGTPLARYTPPGQVHPQTRYTPRPGTPHPTPDQVHPPNQVLCSACWEIRAPSGRYASYWNAFMLIFCL